MQVSNDVAERLAKIICMLHDAVEDGERWAQEEQNGAHELTWQIRCTLQTKALREVLAHLRAAVQ
jgi:hypothetical protein